MQQSAKWKSVFICMHIEVSKGEALSPMLTPGVLMGRRWAAAERGLLEMAASIRFGREWRLVARGGERGGGSQGRVFAMDLTD